MNDRYRVVRKIDATDHREQVCTGVDSSRTVCRGDPADGNDRDSITLFRVHVR